MRLYIDSIHAPFTRKLIVQYTVEAQGIFVISQIGNSDNGFFTFAPFKYNTIIIVIQFTIIAVPENGVPGTKLAKPAVMLQNIFIDQIPGKRLSAKRVGIPFHTDLVAIIDTRHPEEGV